MNRWVHTRHVHLTAPRQCRKQSHGVRTTTVENADAGTLGWRLGSLGHSLVRKGSSHLNVDYVLVYSNGKFAPAGILRHPRHDVTDSIHILMLMGKVYCKHLASKTVNRLLL